MVQSGLVTWDHSPTWLWSPSGRCQAWLITCCHSPGWFGHPVSQRSQCQQRRMASVTRCHGRLRAHSVTAHPSGCPPGVTVRGARCHSTRRAVTKCCGASTWLSPSAGVAVVPRCHTWSGPNGHGSGGFGPRVSQGVRGSLPAQVTVRGGPVAAVPCPRHHGPPGARPACSPRAGPPRPRSRPCCGQSTEDARCLPPPPSSRGVTGPGSGLARGWGRSVTGPGAAATGQCRARRTEPNRTEQSSGVEPRGSQRSRSETS